MTTFLTIPPTEDLPELPDDQHKIDSQCDLREALFSVPHERNCPSEILDSMRLLGLEYYGFDHQMHRGQIVMHHALEEEIQSLFEFMRSLRFPVEKVVPVARYAWLDDPSMADNNSSGFNYRTISGTDRLSVHSFGAAIDINPRLNPWMRRREQGMLIDPPGATYNPEVPGTFFEQHPVVLFLQARGWTWCGEWTDKDYHHFEKPHGIVPS